MIIEESADDERQTPRKPRTFEYELPVLRKRKRSPTLAKSLTPSTMTLRKRVKRDENPSEPLAPANQQPLKSTTPKTLPEEKLDEGSYKLEQLNTNEVKGASFVRYEIIEKKGQKILVPVRYSIRN